MGKKGEGYGSEYHFEQWRKDAARAKELDRRLLEACGEAEGSRVTWVYPADKHTREPRGLDFLKDRPDILSRWRAFWPQRGMPPNWDGLAHIVDGPKSEWVLIEAKANQPEFCSLPCQASLKGGRMQIEHALAGVKKRLGVHRHFQWLGTYYQHANRLAVLDFLTRAKVAARFVEVFITGDTFPDHRPCPANPDEWGQLIEARRLTLGLPARHPLTDRIAHVFVPALSGTP
jgi:hypothetical protein